MRFAINPTGIELEVCGVEKEKKAMTECPVLTPQPRTTEEVNVQIAGLKGLLGNRPT